MKLTAISPCYQEIRFIRGWLNNCRQWADQVIISEGGSADGTRSVIESFARMYPGWITMLDHPQSANPQLELYNEGSRRNALVEQVKEGYVVACDVDEMLPDDARDRLAPFLNPQRCFSLKWVNLWRSRRYIRIGVQDDEHWGPIGKVCIFPAGSVHSSLVPEHTTWVCSLPRIETDVEKFHLHYLFDAPKTFENRIAEAKGVVELTPPGGIRLQLINGKLPSAMRFLSEMINYGEPSCST